MAVMATVRRNLVVAACLSLLLIGLLCTGDSFDMERFDIITPLKAIKVSKNGSPSGSSPSSDFFSARTSRLHFLIPASHASLQFCYHLASAGANRYPVPTLLAWKGEGDFDAKVSHLAKLRALKRYLDTLNGAGEADDLVLLVDAYDIIHQLPAEVLIERYFEIVSKANTHLAQRMGISVQELAEKGAKQTVFFGPDKVCWPPDDNAARCWAAPASSLGQDPFGPERGGPDDFFTKDPRWLNSGTVIGPVFDLKRVVAAAMDEIAATYDPGFWVPGSDQYYLANIFGRQEYWRNRKFLNNSQVVDDGQNPNRVIPAKLTEEQETELHMAIEYESSLFQTKAGNELFTGYLQYNLKDQTANVNIDLFEKGESFRPYPISMPDNVRDALLKLFNSVSDAHPGASTKTWIRLAHLGTNFVTKHIYSIWHCTGGKEAIDYEYTKMWFHPFVKSLLRETVKAWRRNDPISTKLIDGRRWIPYRSYPGKEVSDDEYGGAWSDGTNQTFLTWKEMCGHDEGTLFWGQQATGM
ncbi:hypothetical protein E4U54_007863 [Claviceps lovelessii]|nr:hypothetical protein E4U54_007863 [Claviceps lovelessii]